MTAWSKCSEAGSFREDGFRGYRGLSWELAAVLRASVATDRAVGINVTVFNPRLDKDGANASKLVDALARALNA